MEIAGCALGGGRAPYMGYVLLSRAAAAWARQLAVASPMRLSPAHWTINGPDSATLLEFRRALDDYRAQGNQDGCRQILPVPILRRWPPAHPFILSPEATRLETALAGPT